MSAENKTQPGKRYQCEVCGGQVMCLKPGETALVCCGPEMAAEEPKPMPSAD